MENKNNTRLPENKNYIKLVRKYPDELNLTNRQAKKIFEFEQERLHSGSDMSTWEEWEYERSIFGKILSDEQFKIYCKSLTAAMRQHEKDLKEEDECRSCEIEYYKDLLWYVENDLLSYLKSEIDELLYVDLNPDKARIIFLRAEYQSFLNRKKEKKLEKHFRHNRAFQPNGLQSLLLKNELCRLLPDYWAFYRAADPAVKAVIQYLKKNSSVPDNDEMLLAKKWSELSAVHEESLKKCEKYFPGWNVMTAKHSEEQENEEKTMILMLIDKGRHLTEENNKLKGNRAESLESF